MVAAYTHVHSEETVNGLYTNTYLNGITLTLRPQRIVDHNVYYSIHSYTVSKCLT